MSKTQKTMCMAKKEKHRNLSDKLRTSMLSSIHFEASRGAKISSSNITCPNEHLRNSSIPATSYIVIQVKNICSCCLRQLLLEYSFEQETLKGKQAEILSPKLHFSLSYQPWAFKSCYDHSKHRMVATNRRPTCMDLGQNYHNTPCQARKMTRIYTAPLWMAIILPKGNLGQTFLRANN